MQGRLNIDEYKYMIYELFNMAAEEYSTSDIAYVCNVTTQTVRNMKNGECENPVILAFLVKIGMQKDKELTKMLLTNSFNWED